jgi:putative inorganic carbon (HCO3(-)) transporter
MRNPSHSLVDWGLLQGAFGSDKSPHRRLLFVLLAGGVGIISGSLVVSLPNPLLLPLLFFGGIFGFVLLLQLDLCLLIFVFATYARLPNILSKYHGIGGTKQLLILLILAAIAVEIFVRGEKPKGWLRPALYCMAYLGTMQLSFVVASEIEPAKETFSAIFRAAFSGFLMLFLMRTHRAPRMVVWTLLAVGTLTGSLSVYQEMTGTYNNNYMGFAYANYELVGGKGEYRISGVCQDPNFFAMMLVILMPLALDRFWSERDQRLRLLAGVALFSCGMANVFTFSRGGFLGMAVALGFMMLRRPPRPSTIVLMIVVMLVILPLLPASYSERLLSIASVSSIGSEDASQESSLKGRTSELLSAWAMYTDFPVLGVGLANYKVNYQKYAMEIGLDNRAGRSAHCLYLQVAAETGSFGVITFFALIGASLMSLRRGSQKFRQAGYTEEADLTSALSFGFVGFLVCSVFLHGAYPAYMWFLVGTSFGLENVANKTVAQGSAY